jgi:hypothetical protein
VAAFFSFHRIWTFYRISFDRQGFPGYYELMKSDRSEYIGARRFFFIQDILVKYVELSATRRRFAYQTVEGLRSEKPRTARANP